MASDDQWAPSVIATSAGAAVELLAKSVLVKINLVLIAEKGDLDTVLPLTGVRTSLDLPVTRIKTLGLSQVLLLVKRLYKDFPYSQRPDDLLLRVRNAATHMALVDPEGLGQAVEQFVTLVDALIDLSRWPNRQQFWGPNHKTALVIAHKTQRENEARVQAKLAAARQYLAVLVAGVLESDKGRLFAAMPRPQSRIGADRQSNAACPVCEQPGVLGGMTWDQAEEVKTPEGVFTHVQERIFVPIEFACGICQLRLSDIELNGFEGLLELRRLDLEEDGYEPDEALLDFLRRQREYKERAATGQG